MHVEAVLAPVAAEYVPAPQSMHVEAVLAPVAVEYLPAPQSVHSKEPMVVLYFPAAQAEHVPPLGPVVPASHATTQSSRASLPAGEVVPTGHDKHKW